MACVGQRIALLARRVCCLAVSNVAWSVALSWGVACRLYTDSAQTVHALYRATAPILLTLSVPG